jgi:hypothetical protein
MTLWPLYIAGGVLVACLLAAAYLIARSVEEAADIGGEGE